MSSKTTNGSILLVEDDLDLRENVSLFLEGAGYRVLTADDGVDALTLLQTEPVSLVLSDIEMPRMNGYQLYNQICKNSDRGIIPFLFLSGRDFDSDVRYGKDLGADDYLTKPIQPKDLLTAIQKRLSRIEPQSEVAHREQALAHRGEKSAAHDCSHLNLGRLRIVLDQYRAVVDGRTIKLSSRELKLLVCFARRVDQVIPLEELAQCVAGKDTDYVEAGVILRPLICSLRKKLGHPAGQWIEAVRKAGYRLSIPDRSDS